MSSYWAGYYGEALVLDAEEFEDFCKIYADKHGLDKKTMFDGENISEYEFLRSKNEGMSFSITEVHPDYCDGMYFIPYYWMGEPNLTTFKEDGTILNCIETKEMRSEISYVIYSDYNRMSMKAFLDAPYASYDDFRQEFVEKLESYLPEDFDYDSHIGNFSYACYA